MKTSRRKLFSRPQRRRRWPWLLAASLALAALLSAILWQAGRDLLSKPEFSAGLGAPLQWRSPGQMPDWAATITDKLVEQSRSQYLVALADLNRDQQAELLIAPAVARYDVFIPDTPLRVIWRSPQGWRLTSATLSCRPLRLGGFLTLGWWDLPCPTARGRVLLRWSGAGYRAPNTGQAAANSS